MAAKRPAPAPELRRSVTPWGSFAWGYSDVGADIFVGLGLVLAWAAGASNVAFLFAGVVYVCIGLAYTELAATYPVAGGGQYFVMRGLGDIFGFIAGWAVLLDFTIDVTLFAWSSVDYTSQLAPVLTNSLHPWLHFLAVLGLVLGLCLLNVIGVRESTAFNGFVSALDVISETLILCLGFLFAFQPQLLIHAMHFNWPAPYQLMLGTSLAIVSFVGLESISQAAQETQRPASVIPRTSVALILTILIFALAYSNLALGLHPWHPIVDASGHPMQFWQIFPHNADNQGKAVALLAAQVPYYGALAALYVPVLGAVLLLISSNSGVFGSSRIAYAMSSSNLLPSIFQRVHAVFRTPVISIVFFSTIALIELFFAAAPSLFPALASLYAQFFHGENGLEFLADLYAFGAATSYSFVFLGLIALRFSDPLSPRKFKIPLNIRMRFRGERVELPVIAVIGFIGIFSILLFTLRTHALGRIFGPSWLLLGLILYLVYRRHRRMPLLRSQPRDWRTDQANILRRAGELELMDEYLANVKASDARRASQQV
ncbi:MAG TPA: APC family permease [Candidatus Cybelea sp.]|jgi:APA family basic amino acid/polyamine antiporter|nr:APC family permease [Candidatus Cybelea sp.]